MPCSTKSPVVQRSCRPVRHGAQPVVRARPAHRGNDEIAGCELRDRRADLEHLREALVSEDEMLRARGRRAELEAADLAIGAAHADLQHAQADVGGGADARRIVLDDTDRAFPRKDAQRPHRLRPSHHRKSAFTVGVSRVRL